MNYIKWINLFRGHKGNNLKVSSIILAFFPSKADLTLLQRERFYLSKNTQVYTSIIIIIILVMLFLYSIVLPPKAIPLIRPDCRSNEIVKYSIISCKRGHLSQMITFSLQKGCPYKRKITASLWIKHNHITCLCSRLWI